MPLTTVEISTWQAVGEAAAALRYRVFTLEQGIEARLDQDGQDGASMHAIARSADGEVVGTARLLGDGHLGRMAVLPAYRREGVGSALLQALIAQARRMALPALHLNAQASAIDFYRRHGFLAVGAPFVEVGIAHQAMRLALGAELDATQGLEDEQLWLEAIDSADALAWVAAQNRSTAAVLEAAPGFAPMRERVQAIFESPDRIPMVSARAGWLYNFWQDAQHVRGLWRRCRPHSYALPVPDWQVLLDVDQLALVEQENWVWAGVSALYPDGRRVLLRLSRGGGDAVVTREFDLSTLDFVQDGFQLPEAKAQVSWIDQDQVFVATDFGAGSLTASGYPRSIKRWQRGAPLADAQLEFSAEPEDVMVAASTSRDWFDGVLLTRHWITRRITFQASEYFLEQPAGWRKLALPEDVEIATFADQLLITLKSDWSIGGALWPQGALLAISLEHFLAGARAFLALFTPGPRRVLAGMTSTRSFLYLMQMDDLRPHLERLSLVQGQWRRTPVLLDAQLTTDVFADDADRNDDLWLLQSGPLAPSRWSFWAHGAAQPVVMKALPALFDATGCAVRRFDARSKDGTMVPYMVVGRPDVEGGVATLLSGYGGFEISRLPLPYSAAVGALWLERGGQYVVAGIRGGGEFGPAWHLAAVRENKQHCFDDFIAVAEDLVARGLCQARQLGIQGGSNGGLLVSAVMTQAPQCIGAVVCQVPLIDMRRYHHLLAGASWMAEYGNPDLPEDWAFISAYSPYQKVRADASYPPLLLATSTRDDRVHPGHARKMAARMQAQGHAVLYYENTEGGHAGAANQRQAAHLAALAYTFFWLQLSEPAGS